MDYITGYEINTNGYITEDGKDVFPETIKEMKSKSELLKWAKRKKLDPDYHHICAVVYDLIDGLKVPDTGDPEFLNDLLK